MRDDEFPYTWPAFVRTIANALSDGEFHPIEELRARVALERSLTPDQLAITHRDGQNVFVNTVAQVLARLTTKGAAVRLFRKEGWGYQMTINGLIGSRRAGTEVTINDFSPNTAIRSENEGRVSLYWSTVKSR
jgi:hypothetical protein